MPYSVNCEKCNEVVVFGASDSGKTCQCGWSTINIHYKYPKLYQGCNLDGSRISKKAPTLNGRTVGKFISSRPLTTDKLAAQGVKIRREPPDFGPDGISCPKMAPSGRFFG